MSTSTEPIQQPAPALLAPILGAQGAIHGVIHDHNHAPVAFGRRVSRIEWLNDVAALTRLLATSLPTDSIPPGYADIFIRRAWSDTADQDAIRGALSLWGQQLELTPTVSPAARLRDASLSPIAIALTATAAISIVTSPDLAMARELVGVLPDTARAAAAQNASSRKLSWALAQALDPRTGQAWRGQTPSLRIKTARYRLDGAQRPPLDPGKVPARLWSGVLDHHGLRRDGYTALAASAALLSIGTQPHIYRACERLGHPHLAGRVRHDLSTILGLGDADDSEFFEGLLALHDALATGGVPIDYARRRRTFPHPVPPAARTARRVARELDMRPTPRLARFMGWWVFELLTGNDVLLGERHLDVHASHRIAYARQRDAWNSHPPHALLKRAEHALLVNCLDEPLTWAPRRTVRGTWDCPPPDTSRLLDGWSNRRGRGSSRPATSAAGGLELEDAVAFAASGQSPATERLAVKMARFATVVEVGTITQAAKKIGLRQPSLTDSITALERELALILLDRGTHGFTVTRAGRELHRLVTSGPLQGIDPGQRLQ